MFIDTDWGACIRKNVSILVQFFYWIKNEYLYIYHKREDNYHPSIPHYSYTRWSRPRTKRLEYLVWIERDLIPLTLHRSCLSRHGFGGIFFSFSSPSPSFASSFSGETCIFRWYDFWFVYIYAISRRISSDSIQHFETSKSLFFDIECLPFSSSFESLSFLSSSSISFI